MKYFLTVTFLLLNLSLSGFAQGAKNMYEARITPTPAKQKARSGSKLWVELQEDRKRVPVTTSFKSGQSIRVHFRINYDGYLIVLNQGTTGQMQVLYPRTLPEALVPLSRASAITIPSKEGRSLTFDENKGTERLLIILSEKPEMV